MMMKKAIAFDVYGTLIDTTAVQEGLYNLMGDRSKEFSALWRRKQIEYSFRRNILGQYEPFTRCTEDALKYTCRALDISLSKVEQKKLMSAYLKLPLFVDVKNALKVFAQQNISMYVFSNGSPQDLKEIFTAAGALDFFSKLVSVHEVRKFKPDPEVYAYLKKEIGLTNNEFYFVSANPFDVQGATLAGLDTIWLCRHRDVTFDAWGKGPGKIAHNFEDILALYHQVDG